MSSQLAFERRLVKNFNRLLKDAFHLQPELVGLAEQRLPIPVWVGLSGGVDSVVLLASLHAVASQLDAVIALKAVYINHRLSPNADAWEAFCASFAQSLAIPFVAQAVDVVRAGKGIEDAAREARYGVFSSLMSAPGIFVTAHHADDQVETLLLRLNRGTGLKGLGGMPECRALNRGVLVRPLLTESRQEINAYLAARSLSHIEDESNTDETFDRNFLRQTLLPHLKARWPKFTKTWGESMRAAMDSDNLLMEYAAQDLAQLDLRDEIGGASIALGVFDKWSVSRQQNVIRFWLNDVLVARLQRQYIDEIQQQLAQRQSDSLINFSLPNGKGSLRVFDDRLYLLRTAPRWCVSLVPGKINDGRARLRGTVNDYRIVNREGGERCKPVGRAHSQTLKKLLQSAGVPPWLRENIPLIYAGEHIAAVANLWICDGFLADSHEQGVVVDAVFK